MDKLNDFLHYLDCSAYTYNVCYDNNIVSFKFIPVKGHIGYWNMMAKFNLQNDITNDYWQCNGCGGYDSNKCDCDYSTPSYRVSVNISRLLIDEAINDMLSA